MAKAEIININETIEEMVNSKMKIIKRIVKKKVWTGNRWKRRIK